MTEIAARLERVLNEVAEVSERAGRAAPPVLVAVSKTVSPERIREAYDAGQRVFGENRVQEALGKITALGPEMPEAAWHLIGHLQTNKVRATVPAFTLIESVDSLRLAHKLDSEASLATRPLPVLLEVNVAGEATKSGIDVERLRASIPELQQLAHLDLRGLMTVAPLATDPEDVRWVFRRLRELRDAIRECFDLPALDELSMGMSNDFRVAIQEGATMIRIGRAIFGERPAR